MDINIIGIGDVVRLRGMRQNMNVREIHNGNTPSVEASWFNAAGQCVSCIFKFDQLVKVRVIDTPREAVFPQDMVDVVKEELKSNPPSPLFPHQQDIHSSVDARIHQIFNRLDNLTGRVNLLGANKASVEGIRNISKRLDDIEALVGNVSARSKLVAEQVDRLGKVSISSLSFNNTIDPISLRLSKAEKSIRGLLRERRSRAAKASPAAASRSRKKTP